MTTRRALTVSFAACLAAFTMLLPPAFAAGKPAAKKERPPLDPRLTDTSNPDLVWRFYPGSGDEKLPRVLLIGDSICNGYGFDVVHRLSGKAVTDVWLTPNNLRGWMMLEDLAAILGQGPYDVVHFNIGLHEWDDSAKEDYNFETAMAAYIKTMLKNAQWGDKKASKKAKLIWASITPVSREGALTELKDDQNEKVIQWNGSASNLMTKAGISIDDFYSLMVTNLNLKGDALHWKAEGSAILADAATKAILQQLPGEKKSTTSKKK